MAVGTLLSEIDAFLVETGMASSTFGRLAVNDWRLIDTLRAGREPRSATVKSIRSFMAAHRSELAEKAA